jgi:glutamate synthase (NADPH/NADH) small chain
MSEEKKKEPQTQENPHRISRREFAIGSVAMLGGYSLAETSSLPPLSAEAQAMKLEISPTIQSYMEVRHILEDDLRRVIDHAEKTGEKLYEPKTNILLSKLRMNEVYFYAEYSPIQGGFRILSAYSHRFLLEGD